jgi:hypothetical protein
MEKNILFPPVQAFSIPGISPKAVNPAAIPEAFLMKVLLLLFMILWY